MLLSQLYHCMAEQNQNDITEIRTELRNTKSELTEVLIELKKKKMK